MGQETVLVTGFEPFGPWGSNPLGEAALTLNGTMVSAVGAVLPVTFDTSCMRLQTDAQQGGIPAGFIHVPPTPSQKPYGMELATTLQAVRTAINVTMAA